MRADEELDDVGVAIDIGGKRPDALLLAIPAGQQGDADLFRQMPRLVGEFVGAEAVFFIGHDRLLSLLCLGNGRAEQGLPAGGEVISNGSAGGA